MRRINQPYLFAPQAPAEAAIDQRDHKRRASARFRLKREVVRISAQQLDIICRAATHPIK